MTEHDDTLADLRAAYRGLQPAAPGDDLASEPDDVQMIVADLREAWRTLQAPRGLDEDVAALVRVVRRRRHAVRNRLLRVAAVVLVGVGLSALRFLGGGGLPSPHAGPDVGDNASYVSSKPRVLTATAERVEMRAGPVHLVLVRPETIEQPNSEENKK